MSVVVFGKYFFENVCPNFDNNKKKNSPGEFIAILGPSGAGKSTFLDIGKNKKRNSILSQLDPSPHFIAVADRKSGGNLSGTILFNSDVRTEYHKQYISYVTQQEVLMPKLKVKEVVRFYADMKLSPFEYSSAQKDKLVMDTLKLLELDHKADSEIGGTLPGGLRVVGLSGGQKKRVGVIFYPKKFLYFVTF